MVKSPEPLSIRKQIYQRKQLTEKAPKKYELWEMVPGQ